MATTQLTSAERPTDRASDRAVGAKWRVFLITAASCYSPLTVWVNAGEQPVLTTFLLDLGLMVAIGLLLYLVLGRLGLDRLGSAYAVSLFVFTASNIGSMVGRYHEWDRFVLLVGAALVATLGYRIRELPVVRFIMSWGAIFLVAYPVTMVASEWWAAEKVPLSVDVGTDIETGTMTTKPDVLMVVFDAYGSVEVLEEFYGFDNDGILAELEQEGFVAPGTLSANYARTLLSIPSILQLDYVTTVPTLSKADIDALGRVITGDSRLVEALKQQDYRYVHVESGWLGSRCASENIDICVHAPWPDETFFDLSYRTIVRGLGGFEVGRSHTEGTLNSAKWLLSDLAPYLIDETPDFIFAHILLPHPPLFLDSSCVPDWRGGQPGFALGPAGQGVGERARAGYLAQVQCANTIISGITQMLPSSTAAVFVGDHGPDGQGQLFIPGTEWDEALKRERFGAFYAARVPNCDMEHVESLVNVGRRALSCLTQTDLPDLPLKTYDMERGPDGNIVSELEVR